MCSSLDDAEPQHWLRAFFEQAKRQPNAIAVVSGADSVTYGELGVRSHALADVITRCGSAGEIIGVKLPPSVGLVVTLLAILRSGAAYLALDPQQPEDRTKAMVAETGASLLVTADEDFTSPGVHSLLIDARGLMDDVGLNVETDGYMSVPDPDALAYVIYTSGSTGRPKGVAVQHRALSNLLASMRDVMPLDERDALAAVSSVTFDMSIPELFHPLASGATVLLLDETTRRDPALLTSYLNEAHVTVLHATPSLWRSMLTAGTDGARVVRRLRAFVGAEVLSEDLAISLRALAIEVVNLYGPTETTVWSSASRLTSGIPMLGQPIAQTYFHVLGPGLETVKADDIGELYISGAGLAMGYVGQPSLTAERFIACPFGPAGSRMYRTGDRVRLHRSGELEFIGRVDDQVKVRGFRVELGEIDAIVRSIPDVVEAATVLREDSHGGGLATYVVGSTDHPLDLDQLRRDLRNRLPRHMIPAMLRQLQRLPRNTRGKLDRVALASLAESFPRAVASTTIDSPLAAIVAEVLKVERVGMEEDFFSLGGHSLLAAQLSAMIRARLGREVLVSQIFATPTVAGLTKILENARRTSEGPSPGEGDLREPSFAQERLWYLDAQDPHGSSFNMPLVWEISGEIDLRALEIAVAQICNEHASLRTVIDSVDGRPRPRLLANGARLRVEKLPDEAIEAAASAAARYRFDLASEAPTRWLLLTSSLRKVLVAVTHHIATDGWSEHIIVRDLSHAYAAARRGETVDSLAPRVTYADFAHWQRARLRGDGSGGDLQLEYWRRELTGIVQPINISTDSPRPPIATNAGATLRFEIEAELLAKVRKLAVSRGATASMVLQAAFVSLLHRLGAGQDIAIGALSAGRTHREIADTVGYFGNTWVLRVAVSQDASFEAVLDEVRVKALAAYDRLDVPFERVVGTVNPERSAAYHPLFQVALAFNEAEIAWPTPTFEEARVMPRRVATDTARFDLLVTCDVRKNGSAAVSIEFATDLFQTRTVQRMADQLLRILETVANDHGVLVGDLPMLSEAEHARWQNLSAGPSVELVAPATLVDLVDLQAECDPRAIAVVCGSTVMTFQELVDESTKVARALYSRGIGLGDCVGLSMHRTPALAAALLGILRSGAAYVPLDPKWSGGRLTRILDDARPVLLLVDADVDRQVFPDDVPVLDPRECDAEEHRNGPLEFISSSDVAYLMYTSGSTGKPKGVMVSHGTVVSDLQALVSRIAPEGMHSTLAATSINFDVSVLELFGTWLDGGTVHLVESLADLVGGMLWSGTVLSAVPSVLTAVIDGLKTSVDPEVVVLAGEPLSCQLTERIHVAWPNARVVNSYGQTESFYATMHAMDPVALDHQAGVVGTVPIGLPLAGVFAYLLDDALRPVQVGTIGDLYVGGAIASGYVGRDAETASRFIADPFGHPGARMYRTGDRAIWNDQGALEHVGRADAQVKVRGIRIEPFEIAGALERLDDVVAAMVIPRLGKGDGVQLCAYVSVRDFNRPPSEHSLRARLAIDLPSMMLPDRMVVVRHMPLLDNGKVDTLALPEPEWIAESAFAPRSADEQLLARLFAEVLGREHIGVNDNFFDLGGHSLRVAILASRIGKEYGTRCSMIDILHHPTPASFAEAVVAPWHELKTNEER